MERASKYEQWQLGALIDTTFLSTPVGLSALRYFSETFQHSLKLKLARRHGFPEQAVAVAAELYDRMIPLVLEARTVLEAEAGGLLGPWQEATGADRMAYQTVLTGVVVQSPEMRAAWRPCGKRRNVRSGLS